MSALSKSFRTKEEAAVYAVKTYKELLFHQLKVDNDMFTIKCDIIYTETWPDKEMMWTVDIQVI